MKTENNIIMEIADGRGSFYQWDLGRRLRIHNLEHCNEVHFTNSGMEHALVCRVYEEDGVRFVNVPNILLQSEKMIRAYAYLSDTQGESTTSCCSFEVRKRNQPRIMFIRKRKCFHTKNWKKDLLCLRMQVQ